MATVAGGKLSKVQTVGLDDVAKFCTAAWSVPAGPPPGGAPAGAPPAGGSAEPPSERRRRRPKHDDRERVASGRPGATLSL